MGGGAHRGPVGLGRQRRAVRTVQVLLVLVAAGLLVFAGYSFGLTTGFEQGRSAGELGAPESPSWDQTLVVGALGIGALGAAFLLQGPRGVRIPAPSRLDELAGRAEATAVGRVQEAASDVSGSERGPTT